MPGDIFSDRLNLFDSLSAVNSLLTDISKDVLECAKSIKYDLDRRFINFKEFVDLLE